MFIASKGIAASEFVVYTIRKGNHGAEGTKFKEIRQAEISLEAIFDSSAIYQTRRAENQSDINKLFGFSDCGAFHHENSARFGWRWNGRSIELHAYWYSDSTRYTAFLDTVSIENTINLALSVLPKNYRFQVNSKTFMYPRHCSSGIIEGYLLYPYFGGDEVAPHDIKIRIKERK